MPAKKKQRIDPGAHWAAIVESSDDAIISKLLDGTLTSWNKGAERIFGYSAEEVIGKSVTLLIPPGMEDEEPKILKKIRKGERIAHYISRRRRKDGTILDVSLSISPIFSPKGTIVGASKIARDITSQRQADAARLHLAAVVESSVDAIVTKSLEGMITSWNDGAHQMFGYSSSEIIGKPISALIPPDRQNEEPVIIAKILRGEHVSHYETVRRRKDGSLVDVSLTISPIKDERGGIVGISKIVRDITERKRLELQLSHSQRMEMVGKLAGGVAHDFNNLLTPILGYSQLVLEKLGPQDPARADLEEIKRAGERAAALTRQLLAFSRRQVLQPKVLDLNPLVSEMGKLLSRVLGEDVTLTLVLAPKLGRIRVDPGQMDQVIMNLAVNSRDAMPNGGKFTIETANAELDEAYCKDHPEVLPGRYLVLIASDTGSGMDKETLSHLFEPFFTTKEVGKGTGLGLATVQGIVKQSGGHIWVYSEPGRGTSFKIYFPRVDEEAEPLERSAFPLPSDRGTETVLLAEDDAALRALAVRILKSKGYVVLEAARGEEALSLSKKHAGSIDLLLTDVVMPGMSGRELAKQVVMSRPGIKIVYMSGYTENAIVHHGVLDEGTILLDKPFTPDTLARTIRKALDVPKKEG